LKNLYIQTLPEDIQAYILNELTKLNLSSDDIDNAMNSRLCDLEDTINIYKLLKWLSEKY
jgi:hypothetical protein